MRVLLSNNILILVIVWNWLFVYCEFHYEVSWRLVLACNALRGFETGAKAWIVTLLHCLLVFEVFDVSGLF